MRIPMAKVAMALVMATALFTSDVSLACGSHGGCGGVRSFSFSLTIRSSGGGCGGGMCGGGGYYGGGYYGRPWFGGGAMAFRRSNRLAFRSMRAARWGFYGRSARLAYRSDAAFGRGMYRAGGYRYF